MATVGEASDSTRVGFSSTALWEEAEPIVLTMPSPTRARMVSSPAPADQPVDVRPHGDPRQREELNPVFRHRRHLRRGDDLAGLVFLWRTRPATTLLISAVTLTFASGYALFAAKLRYRIPVLPLLFVLAGVGAWQLMMGVRALLGMRVSTLVDELHPHPAESEPKASRNQAES